MCLSFNMLQTVANAAEKEIDFNLPPVNGSEAPMIFISNVKNTSAFAKTLIGVNFQHTARRASGTCVRKEQAVRVNFLQPALGATYLTLPEEVLVWRIACSLVVKCLHGLNTQ